MITKTKVGIIYKTNGITLLGENAGNKTVLQCNRRNYKINNIQIKLYINYALLITKLRV
jgi:hypothetical protein